MRLSAKTSEGISSECLQGLEVMHIPSPLLGLPTPHGWKLMPGGACHSVLNSLRECVVEGVHLHEQLCLLLLGLC